MSYDLVPETARSYAIDQGVLPRKTPQDSVRVVPLGGGISNTVLQARTENDCLVMKQPRSNLAVEDDWPADINRIHNEAAATRVYEDIITAANFNATVPSVRFEDDDAHVIGLECAPADAPMWKRELLNGEIDLATAQAVGDVLGVVHDHAAGNSELREVFKSKTAFDQLRVDPYHQTIARRHPDVAEAIRAETERMTGIERTLVHGDYSPKNVLVKHEADDSSPVPWILDFEVAHWGDPAFDTGFMLNHLLIKSIHNHEHQAAYLDAARAFWETYDEQVSWNIERDTTRELGVLMLARVDGKSPVEYIDDQTAAVLRRVAKRILHEGDALSEVITFVREEAHKTWR